MNKGFIMAADHSKQADKDEFWTKIKDEFLDHCRTLEGRRLETREEALTGISPEGYDGNYPRPDLRGRQAPTVLRMVPNTVVLVVKRAVSTTVRTAASPLAAHMAR